MPANERAAAKAFAASYYREMDPEDFATRDAAAWCELALNHLRFGQEFQTGAAKMRIFSPKTEEHGWTSSTTVIEFINDDMPFLVDSIAIEINRQGIATHFVIHPLFDASRDHHGQLTQLAPPHDGVKLESWIHVEVERITDPARIKALGDGLVAVLSDVRSSVEDWPR